jgi:DNA-binding transcriptional LysR family regulator
MIALPIGLPLRYVIVASPDYIKHHGEPKTPHDLSAHNCIRRRFPGGTLVNWHFSKDDEKLEITPQGRLTVSSALNEMQAALAGKGIAHVIDDYARRDIESGRLVEVIADWSLTLPHWFLYYPSRRLPSATMRAFLDFMRSYDWDANKRYFL